ncbi:MAG: hypothetical protein U1F10_00780 [Burkholderiales bacterium]
MPTARELLEQADALMRRNRGAAPDDIPVLTEAVSPKPVFRVPLRPSPESPPAPLPDVELGADEAPADAIPTLTEKVPVAPAADSGAVLAEGEPSDWLDLDEGEPSITGKAPDSVLSVPEVVPAEALRDDAGEGEPQVAEEIEIAPAAEADFAADFDGPPSAESVAEPESDVPPSAPPDAEPEGDGPPPAVPAAPHWAATAWPESELPPEVEAPPALAAEAGLVFESPTSVSWNVEAVLSGPPAEAAVPTVPEAVPATAFAAPPATEADEPLLPVPPSEAAPAATAVAHPVPLVPSPAEVFAARPPADDEVADAALPRPDDDVADAVVPPPDADVADAPEAPATASVAMAPLAAAPPAPPADVTPVAAATAAAQADDARWDAMAEEIRMQVLQRIDLFTDTGLREQLGRRLQPIVDRASADLVATINQHVGELLRAYVAEAIEREIERWRAGQ